MHCLKCGFENSVGRKFCSECGTPLTRGCPHCGAENAPTAKFCGECGTSLSAPARVQQPETPLTQPRDSSGERRHLTVMFCDLVSASEISARFDPEEWHEVEADYLRAVAEAIKRFGGFVAKYLGEGVLAYFGWPEAHDNDAERAARAGLAILEGIDALNQRERQDSAAKISVRVGIDSGTVVIGKGGGSDSEVFGDTANIASRVQSSADPDTVLVSASVNRLISGLFVVMERGTHQLKGIPQPIEMYRIVKLSGARNRLAASVVRGLTPFVGRAEEMALLWNRWQRASDGEGQAVFITGEAGIGKSRLVRQFRERLRGTPHTWNECAGASYFQNTPFYPMTDMLQQGFVQGGNESDEAKLAQLEKALELAGLKLLEAVPLIAPMLNVSVSEKYSPLTLPPEQKRKRLLATLAGWFLGAARVQPIVMAVEDLHWFDASTLEVMQLLIEQGAASRLLLLSTARPEFQAPWPRRTHHTQLNLNRLIARDVRELVGQVVSTKALSEDTIDQVIERTGGVPLFVEELTRAVLEKGDGKRTAREIPATLHDSLIARLDQLGPAKELAQIASVIGREFSYEVLRVVSQISEDDLQSALARLADAELIYARGIPPEANYSFKHALIQEAAYDTLLKSRRRELHRRVAVAIKEDFPDCQLELVARHWTDAGETELAIVTWREAGDAAFERHALKEAENAYRQAHSILKTLPEPHERDGLERELMKRFAQVLQITQGWAAPEAAAVAELARELSEKSGDLAQLVPQMTGSFATAITKGDLPTASAVADRILQLAERDGSPAVLGSAYACQVTACYCRGDLSGAEKHFRSGAAMFEVSAREVPSVMGSFGVAAHVAWMLGNAETARDRMRQAIAGAVALKSPFELAYAQYLSAALQLFMREFADAKTAATSAVALADEHGYRQYGSGARIFLGLAEAALGNPAEGVQKVEEGLRGLTESGTGIMMTLYLSWVGVSQWLDGKVLEALGTIEKALQVNPAELSWRPDTIRLRGELHWRLAQVQEAERDFREAILVARKIAARAWEIRAALSLARMLKARGDLTEARDLLAPLYASFTEGFDTVDLKDAKALLMELEG